MKEPWSISKEKLVSLEEGTSRNEEHECAKLARRNYASKQAKQCVKLFLYLGLLMIVAWACYSIWQPYQAQSMEVKVVAIIREPESQNLHLLEEQPTHETSTIAARSIYGSEDSKRQDAVDDLQKFSPDDQDEILNSENTESSLGWPTSTEYPDLPKLMNFPFFSPSFSSMKMDESEKESGSSESAQRLFDISIYNISEESQQLKEDEKIRLENYMLLSLLVQNSVRISEALKDSKEVVDPKLQLKLEGFGRLGLENSGPLELEDSSRLELDNSGPLQWFNLGQLESQKEIDSDLEDSQSEEKPISTETDDNYESATLNILNNTHEIVSEEYSTEPEQEETLIKSNEQMHQSIDSAVEDWYDQSASEDRKHEEEQATDETEAEIEDDSIGNTYSLGLHSDTGGSSLENESHEESEYDSFDWETYKSLLNLAQRACSDTSLYSWEELEDLEDPNNSYDSDLLDICNERTKAFCEYEKRRLKFTDCSKYNLFWRRRGLSEDFDTSYSTSE